MVIMIKVVKVVGAYWQTKKVEWKEENMEIKLNIKIIITKKGNNNKTNCKKKIKNKNEI